MKFEKEQFKKIGKHAIFVPSGGQGPDEVISESEAMARYLLEQGVEPERILCEDKSVNTLQNMQFSKAKIEEHVAGTRYESRKDGSAPEGSDVGSIRHDLIRDQMIAFATTNYHIFRGYILSSKCGFDAKGISSKTKTYFYPNAYLREFIGLLVDKWYVHLITVTGIILFFLVMDWFAGS